MKSLDHETDENGRSRGVGMGRKVFLLVFLSGLLAVCFAGVALA
jgi:hypothetical protein